MIHALEIRFTLLDKKNELMLLALTGYAAEGIRENIVHIALNMSICNLKSLSINVSGILTH